MLERRSIPYHQPLKSLALLLLYVLHVCLLDPRYQEHFHPQILLDRHLHEDLK